MVINMIWKEDDSLSGDEVYLNGVDDTIAAFENFVKHTKETYGTKGISYESLENFIDQFKSNNVTLRSEIGYD